VIPSFAAQFKMVNNGGAAVPEFFGLGNSSGDSGQHADAATTTATPAAHQPSRICCRRIWRGVNGRWNCG
jgi:hypothetical protein